MNNQNIMDGTAEDLWDINIHWACGLCFVNQKIENLFNDDAEFQDHINRFCHICNQDFSSPETWQRHQSKHFNSIMNKNGEDSCDAICQFCCKTFVSTESNDLEHEVGIHRMEHNLYQCIGCSVRFKDFVELNIHAKACAQSWKKMFCATVIYDCRTCSQLSKGLKELLVHYVRCLKKVEFEAKETGLMNTEVRDAILKNLSCLTLGMQQFKSSIKVPQSAVLNPSIASRGQNSNIQIPIIERAQASIPKQPAARKKPSKRKTSEEPSMTRLKSTRKKKSTTSLYEALDFVVEHCPGFQEPKPMEFQPIPKVHTVDDNSLPQISSVNSLLDDAFETPDKDLIEKVINLSSRRPDILKRIVTENEDSIRKLLWPNGIPSQNIPKVTPKIIPIFAKTEPPPKRKKTWRDYKPLLPMKPCKVYLNAMNVDSSSFHVTPASVPRDFHLFGLENFELLDNQDPVQKPPKNIKRFTSKRFSGDPSRNLKGWSNGQWLMSSLKNKM